ncbi:MAG: hypothetical protein ACQEVT_01145 [Pseudomonadota bacterium]
MSTHTRLKRVDRLEGTTEAPAQVVDAVFVMPQRTTEANNPEIRATLHESGSTGFAYILSGPLAGKQVSQEDRESLKDFEARVAALL